MKTRRLAALALAVMSTAGCGSGSGDGGEPGDSAGDALDVERGAGDAADVETGAGDAADGDVGPAPYTLDLFPTIPAPAPDPFASGEHESCPVYLDERCNAGNLQRCEIYGTEAGAWQEEPDATLRRVYLYDRWYERYHSPDGQTAERVFTGPMPGDTPESVWGAPESFARFVGAGDSATWTGVATTADAFRYAVTGTEADYQRMERHVRTMLRKFDVTGIPGYMARNYFLYMPEGTPASVQTDQLIVRFAESWNLTDRDNPIEDPESVDGLPAAFLDGLPDADGNLHKGTPMWNGVPSIDQYTGPMVAFPVVYPLLRDESLKARIALQMTCYLKRLQRIEIINLQENPEVVESLTAFLGGADLQLDPGDIDLKATERMVLYVNPGFNAANRDTYDRGCPATISNEPVRVLDAADPGFLLDMLDLAADIDDSAKPPNPDQLDHYYVPNVRGADASHLMHLAAMSYYFTGEEQYLDFLYDTLIGDLGTLDVTLTMAAFRQPPFCYRFYADHITFGPHWQLITMLDDSPLKEVLVRAMEEELWQKALFDQNNAKFDVMYASSVPESVATARGAAIEAAALILERFGGNDPNLEEAVAIDAPRRTYSLDPQLVMDNFEPGVTLRCPTEDERARCEQAGELFGVPLEPELITHDCDGSPQECVMADGKCAYGIASEGLMPRWRDYGDFAWQRTPFRIGASFGVEGGQQSPGRDLSETYWLARYYGFITAPGGPVLAWRDLGEACP